MLTNISITRKSLLRGHILAPPEGLRAPGLPGVNPGVTYVRTDGRTDGRTDLTAEIGI